MTRRNRRLLIFSGLIVILLTLITFGADWYATKRLKKWLDDQEKRGYTLTYHDVSVSIWSRAAAIDSLSISTNASLKPSGNKISGHVSSIKISSVQIWKLLSGKGIFVGTVDIRQPKLQWVTSVDSFQQSNQRKQPFFISRLSVHDGDVAIYKATSERPYLEAKLLNVEISGLGTQEQKTARLPVRFDAYNIKCNHLFYKPGPIYHLAASDVAVTEHSFEAKKFEMLPDVSRSTFLASLKVEEDFYRIRSGSIVIPELAWGFHDRRFFVKAKRLDIRKADALIYRNKKTADDKRKRRMYNRLLRELPFDLELGTLALGDARIVYQEQINSRGPGQLTFSHFDVNATNIRSGFGQNKLPDVHIRLATQFMEDSKLKVDWRFNVLDKTDGFRMRGEITNFDASSLDPFSKPYSNLKTKGKLQYVAFDIAGNDLQSQGTVSMRYEDLKVRIYRKKKPSKKSKIASAVGNLLVKNDTDGIKSTGVKVNRKPDASIYNFIWLNVQEGMRKIIL